MVEITHPLSPSADIMTISARRILTTGFGTLLFASALVALPVAAANAASVTNSFGFMQYYGDGTENNNVTISLGGGNFTITDTGGVTITNAGGCTVSGNTATCPASGVHTVYVFLRAGNDSLTVQNSVTMPTQAGGEDGDDTLRVLTTGYNDSLDGGNGNDTLSGGSGNDSLSGGNGNDLLNAEAGDDSLGGHDGTDRLVGGDGNDSLDPGTGIFDEVGGGNGRDTVHYNRATPVSVSLDGAENDGESGESDNVDSTVEVINGGPAADTLTGNSARNILNGQGGDDTLNGGGGNDRLNGSSGNDILNGNDGDDTLDGSSGADTFSGGGGSDYTSYSTDHDVSVTMNNVADDGPAGEGDNVRSDMEEISTGSGDDTLVGTNAANEFSTGDGNDKVTASGGSDGINGGRGRDNLNGGTGVDSIHGEAGADAINSKDTSKDYVTCGGSVDKVTRNSGDQIAADCENVA